MASCSRRSRTEPVPVQRSCNSVSTCAVRDSPRGGASEKSHQRETSFTTALHPDLTRSMARLFCRHVPQHASSVGTRGIYVPTCGSAGGCSRSKRARAYDALSRRVPSRAKNPPVAGSGTHRVQAVQRCSRDQYNQRARSRKFLSRAPFVPESFAIATVYAVQRSPAGSTVPGINLAIA